MQAIAADLGLDRLAELETAAVHRRPVPPRLVERLAQVERTPLTPRRREVVTLLAAGLTKAEIAEELGVSYETVRSHVKLAYSALGAHSVVQAVNALLDYEG